jgi:hypothetical protein
MIFQSLELGGRHFSNARSALMGVDTNFRPRFRHVYEFDERRHRRDFFQWLEVSPLVSSNDWKSSLFRHRKSSAGCGRNRCARRAVAMGGSFS